MHFQNLILSVSLAVGVLSPASYAMPVEEIFRRQSSCTASSVSCSGSTSSCCVPSNGIMVLALQWLPGYCNTVSCASGVLSNLVANAWTIHGLWPDTCSGSQVGTCDSSRQYSDTQSQISNSAIYNDMLTYWVSNSGDYNTFWNHEWGKHGTCYSPADSSCTGANGSNGNDLVKFFGDVLTLRNRFDIYSALANAGITPGGSYSATSISSAISKAYNNVAVGLQCSGGYLTGAELSLVGVGGGVVAKSISTNAPSNSCSGTVKYVANPNGGKTVSTTTTKSSTTTSATTVTSSTSTKTSTSTTSSTGNLGTCKYAGDTYCLYSDGTSSAYKYCDGSHYYAANCGVTSSGTQYLDNNTGTSCYQDQTYTAGCY